MKLCDQCWTYTQLFNDTILVWGTRQEVQSYENFQVPGGTRRGLP